MIYLAQYRISVGCFYYKRPSSGAPRAKSYIVLYGILKIGIECTIIWVLMSMLLLLRGDIELVPRV